MIIYTQNSGALAFKVIFALYRALLGERPGITIPAVLPPARFAYVRPTHCVYLAIALGQDCPLHVFLGFIPKKQCIQHI
jgi:hypothetical protein